MTFIPSHIESDEIYNWVKITVSGAAYVKYSAAPQTKMAITKRNRTTT
tara:strand:+ start:1153 stop:1296 length:144 start_codon:yes stop_codon:yes gene_type:complete